MDFLFAYFIIIFFFAISDGFTVNMGIVTILSAFDSHHFPASLRETKYCVILDNMQYITLIFILHP